MGFCMTTCKEAKQMRTGINITATIRDKSEPRTVNTKYGEAQVCDAYLEDDSGRIKFTIWGDDIQKVKNGDTVAIENGYTTIFRNEVQLNKPRNSKMEVITEEEEIDYSPIPKINKKTSVYRNYESVEKMKQNQRLQDDKKAEAMKAEAMKAEAIKEGLAKKFCPGCETKLVPVFSRMSPTRILRCPKCEFNMVVRKVCTECGGKDGECTDYCKCKKCEDTRKPDPNFQISDPNLSADDEKAAHLIWWQGNQRELGR